MSGSESVEVLFCLFMYCHRRSSYQEGRNKIALSDLSSPLFEPVPRQDPQGLAVIFSHHQVCNIKKKGGHVLGGPKVKVEFRHLFSLQKRFSLCSSHKINANIDVFC
jgi:hypothetical protein